MLTWLSWVSGRQSLPDLANHSDREHGNHQCESHFRIYSHYNCGRMYQKLLIAIVEVIVLTIYSILSSFVLENSVPFFAAANKVFPFTWLYMKCHNNIYLLTFLSYIRYELWLLPLDHLYRLDIHYGTKIRVYAICTIV